MDTRATLLHLLIAAVQPLPPEEAARKVEVFFERAYGQFPSADQIPDEGLALLLRVRASTAIIHFLFYELHFMRETGRRVEDFGEKLARAAAETPDLRLAACHAYFRDLRQLGTTGEAFEKAAARLRLAPDTVSILGLSRGRYREAVDLLMAEGAIDDAERYCRVNRDPGLAAVWAERRGDQKGAVKYYREARDFVGALRCARASGDQRAVARALEWRGEFTEALRIWKHLGRKAEVGRLLKKYPLLGT